MSMKYAYRNLAILIIVIGAIVFGCTKDAGTASQSSDIGKGGSLARFTIVGNYLYAVDNHFLYAYNISDPASPVKTGTSAIGFDIETIYSFKNRLFLGTRLGLYIYSIDTPSVPSKISEARHARACDPVVANDSVAFVTLKGNTACGPAEDGLYIHDVKNLFAPVLKKMVAMSTPEGLGLADSALYICCGNNGLRVYNVAQPYKPVERKLLKDGVYRDVIADNKLLVCLVTTGILLYDISNPFNPVLINKLSN